MAHIKRDAEQRRYAEWLNVPVQRAVRAEAGGAMSSSDHTGARAAIPVATELVLRHGLSEREVLVRRANGQGNTAPAPTSRSYRQIILENVFTFINLCLFGLGIAL